MRSSLAPESWARPPPAASPVVKLGRSGAGSERKSASVVSLGRSGAGSERKSAPVVSLGRSGAGSERKSAPLISLGRLGPRTEPKSAAGSSLTARHPSQAKNRRRQPPVNGYTTPGAAPATPADHDRRQLQSLVVR